VARSLAAPSASITRPARTSSVLRATSIGPVRDFSRRGPRDVRDDLIVDGYADGRGFDGRTGHTLGRAVAAAEIAELAAASDDATGGDIAA
jgi:hypothetical protein